MLADQDQETSSIYFTWTVYKYYYSLKTSNSETCNGELYDYLFWLFKSVMML